MFPRLSRLISHCALTAGTFAHDTVVYWQCGGHEWISYCLLPQRLKPINSGMRRGLKAYLGSANTDKDKVLSFAVWLWASLQFCFSCTSEDDFLESYRARRSQLRSLSLVRRVFLYVKQKVSNKVNARWHTLTSSIASMTSLSFHYYWMTSHY